MALNSGEMARRSHENLVAEMLEKGDSARPTKSLRLITPVGGFERERKQCLGESNKVWPAPIQNSNHNLIT
jgi:hypothetical protein